MKSIVASLLNTSPFGVLKEHALTIEALMKELIALFQSSDQSNWTQASHHHHQIIAYEKHADALKKVVRRLLKDQAFLPISRRDLVESLHLQDALANQLKDIAGLFIGRQMQVIEPWKAHWFNLVNIVERAISLMVKLHEQLCHLIEIGFRERMQQILFETVSAVENLEREHDHVLMLMRQALHAVEHGLPAIDAWFYYQFLDRMGDVTDNARRLAWYWWTVVER